MNEAELIQAAQEGDCDAFLELLKSHDRQIMSVIYRMSGDLYDREDLYQEIFLHCFQSIKSFRARSSLRTWLYRVALNRCIDYMKKKPLVREVVDEAGPSKDWVRAEKLRDVERAMARLKGHQRTCFFLHYIEGWKIREIREVLCIQEGTIKSHLSRARKKIRRTQEVLRWQTSTS